MKTATFCAWTFHSLVTAGIIFAALLHTPPGASAAPSAKAPTSLARTAEAIPWDRIGAEAGADYKGDGLAVTATATGARLHCVFQRIEGEATREGLWLTSTVTNQQDDRFRVTAVAVGRVDRGSSEPPAVELHALHPQAPSLPGTGTVSVDGQSVRFSRAGLIEKYSVSMDGMRQDFVVLQKPALIRSSCCDDQTTRCAVPSDDGELRVDLAVMGATAEQTAGGAQLVLKKSARKIAYNRLRVTDATGRELSARIEVSDTSEIRNPKSEIGLAVLVNDTDAVYPVRIDPTFSDANWISMNPTGITGVQDDVFAAVMDGSGNLYIGGAFRAVGGVFATNIAKWNGSSWSALGSGMGGGFNAIVAALAVSGSDLYVGGYFTTAGGTPATNIAKWDGSNWSALGSGLNNFVSALAVSGNDVFAGGAFTNAGGSAANYIAKWNGSNWSALGSGMNGPVYALAVSGSDLYAAGAFNRAGGILAYHIAKWNGSSWSALGSGLNDLVFALAVSGSDLYAGGYFDLAGGNNIAKWNGSSWSALGSGFSAPGGDIDPAYVGVTALAVSGGDLYAGGGFSTAGGKLSPAIARARIDFTPDTIALKANVPGAHTNTLTFAGVPNYPYIVEYSTNLTGSPWFTLSTTAPATNGVGTALDPAATDPQRFYRVGYQE